MSKGRILLVNPNQMKPAVAPIALDYLADALVGRGFAVDLLDLCFAADLRAEIAAHLGRAEVDVVGVTFRNTDDCYFTGQDSFLPRLKAVTDCLRQHTAAPIVVGGVGFSVLPEGVLDYCGLDLGVAGDGEDALPDLAARLVAGEDYRGARGLVHRGQRGWVRNPRADADLPALPPRRRDLLDNRRYYQEGGQGGFETKRGCPSRCTYCADPVSKGRRRRMRLPGQVADEIEALLAQGVDHLHTCDAEFNLPPEHAAAVCQELIHRGLGERVRWYAYCSPVPFTAELAGLMRRAGCVGINFGADSGSDAMLRRLGRRHRAEDLRRTARHCRQAGLWFMYDLLLGGPGETRETLAQTIDLMKEVSPHRVGVALGVRVYPGTALAREVWGDGGEPRPGLVGKIGPRGLLDPVFYLAPELFQYPSGQQEIFDYVRQLIGDDHRFLFGATDEVERNYNYNDNSLLVQAIHQGQRGAYWDILRRMVDGSTP